VACRARIRSCPVDSLALRIFWALATSAGSMWSSSLFATAQASASVSRVITCSRMPYRSSRPAAAARPRIQFSFSATCSGGSPQVR
jgi:hypothetical protein